MARFYLAGGKNYRFSSFSNSWENQGNEPGEGISTASVWLNDGEPDTVWHVGQEFPGGGPAYIGTIAIPLTGGRTANYPVFQNESVPNSISIGTFIFPADESILWPEVLNFDTLRTVPFQALVGPTPGNDDFSGVPGPESVSLDTGHDIFRGLGGRDLVNGDAGRDSIYGQAGDDVISGDGGRDKLFGGSGNDHLNGDGGGDLLNGGKGDDLLNGDAGRDRIIGGGGDDRIYGDDGRDNLSGGKGEDTIEGDAGHDKLTGGGQDDWLSGGDGDDRLFGGPGSDILEGQGGNDTVFGGGGDDRIWIGDGDGDTLLTGGRGADSFSWFGGAGRDLGTTTITDFDLIDDRLIIFVDNENSVQVDARANRTVVEFEGGRILLEGLSVDQDDLSLTVL